MNVTFELPQRALQVSYIIICGPFRKLQTGVISSNRPSP